MPLFVVGTPIGNLQDLSKRAIDTLRSSDIILGESINRLMILLEYAGIKDKKLLLFREDNKRRMTPEIIQYIREGRSVALTSDAGMPSISDPGSYLINEVLLNRLPLIPVPGPTAFSSALSICGFSAREAVFIGFLPRRDSEIEEIFNFYRKRNALLIFYESPERIFNTLNIINRIDPSSSVFVAREMTKQYEEFIRGSPLYLLNLFAQGKKKGEFTVVIKFSETKEETDIDPKLIEILKNEGIKTKTIAKILSKYYKIPSRSIYNELIKKGFHE